LAQISSHKRFLIQATQTSQSRCKYGSIRLLDPCVSPPKLTRQCCFKDTAGQERFSSLSSAFFRGADAALLIFDINEPHTMHALVKWWDEFKARAPLDDDEARDYCCIVVGNKMDTVDKSSAHVSEAEALRFLDVLVPPSPRSLSPDVDVENPLSESQLTIRPPSAETPQTPSPPLPPPLSLSAAAISISSPSTPTRQHTSHPTNLSSRFLGGTTTSTRTIYHTPSSSLFDQYYSAHASPEPSSDAQTRLSQWSRSASVSPERPLHSPVSTSSESALTMTPSLFARGTGNGHSVGVNTHTGATSLPSGVSKTLDRYPRVFFTSAKTGAGIAEVFEYIARRVVMRWEYEEAAYAHVRETSAADTIRLGLIRSTERRAGQAHGTTGICCSA
jgi:Ras-related protein Rab-7A